MCIYFDEKIFETFIYFKKYLFIYSSILMWFVFKTVWIWIHLCQFFINHLKRFLKFLVVVFMLIYGKFKNVHKIRITKYKKAQNIQSKVIFKNLYSILSLWWRYLLFLSHNRNNFYYKTSDNIFNVLFHPKKKRTKKKTMLFNVTLQCSLLTNIITQYLASKWKKVRTLYSTSGRFLFN